MLDAVEPCTLLVVRVHDVPGALLAVGGLEHPVPRPGVLEPLLSRGKVGLAQLPLAQRVLDPRLEASGLLLVAHLEPVLEQDDPVLDHQPLEARDHPEEALALVRGTEPEHVFDACSVVPAAIEDHDLSGRREMRDVPLGVQLGLLHVGWRWKSHDAEDPRAHSLGDGLDDSALPRAVASLEDDDDLEALVLHPFLKPAELGLETAEVPPVLLALHPARFFEA